MMKKIIGFILLSVHILCPAAAVTRETWLPRITEASLQEACQILADTEQSIATKRKLVLASLVLSAGAAYAFRNTVAAEVKAAEGTLEQTKKMLQELKDATEQHAEAARNHVNALQVTNAVAAKDVKVDSETWTNWTKRHLISGISFGVQTTVSTVVFNSLFNGFNILSGPVSAVYTKAKDSLKSLRYISDLKDFVGRYTHFGILKVVLKRHAQAMQTVQQDSEEYVYHVNSFVQAIELYVKELNLLLAYMSKATVTMPYRYYETVMKDITARTCSLVNTRLNEMELLLKNGALSGSSYNLDYCVETLDKELHAELVDFNLYQTI